MRYSPGPGFIKLLLQTQLESGLSPFPKEILLNLLCSTKLYLGSYEPGHGVEERPFFTSVLPFSANPLSLSYMLLFAKVVCSWARTSFDGIYYSSISDIKSTTHPVFALTPNLQGFMNLITVFTALLDFLGEAEYRTICQELSVWQLNELYLVTSQHVGDGESIPLLFFNSFLFPIPKDAVFVDRVDGKLYIHEEGGLLILLNLFAFENLK